MFGVLRLDPFACALLKERTVSLLQPNQSQSQIMTHASLASTTPPQRPALDPARSFQGLILTLQNFWAGKGCVILQPYDMEVGAGTFHPGTTLRALGPKPWNAAYVQPSRRPKDGRYGENPNRLQHYYQYQVILKPNPPNLQELYLGIARRHRHRRRAA